jgi:RinA family phage transcriptional activator
MNIKRANFKMIEAELYCYHESKKQLELLREEIIESTPSQEISVKSSPGDPTQTKAIKLVNNREIIEMERRLKAIDKAIEILKTNNESRKYELLKMKYFERRYTDVGICMELGISERTFYRWRREIIELIANFLGCRV